MLYCMRLATITQEPSIRSPFRQSHFCAALIVENDQTWASATVLDILTDLLTFEPEPGYETVTLGDGQTISLTVALHHEIQLLRSIAAHIARDGNRSESLRARAHEFLKMLDNE